MDPESGPPAEEEKEISKSAPVVLTGGHGGAVPACIVNLVRKIFFKSD